MTVAKFINCKSRYRKFTYPVYSVIHVRCTYIHTLFIGSHYDPLKEGHEVKPTLRSLLTDNPPRPGKVDHTTEGVHPLLFSNSGVSSFTSHKNQVSASAVRRDLRFFVLIRED